MSREGTTGTITLKHFTLAVVNINNTQGGLNLTDERKIGDNQFQDLKNMYYDEENRLSTRRGLTTFGTSIGSNPITSSYFIKNSYGRFLLVTAGTGLYKYNDSTDSFDLIYNHLSQYDNKVTIHACNTTSPTFAGSGDAQEINTDTTTYKRANASVKFSLGTALSAPSGTSATLTASPTSVDLTNYSGTGKLRFWFQGASTVSSIEVRWGSSATDYWSKTLTTDINGTAIDANFRFFEIDWATASTTGAPNAAAVGYLQVILTHSAVAYTQNLRIDDFVMYPTTSAAGTKLTRASFAHYNGGVAIVNGVDPYMIYSCSSTGLGSLTVDGFVQGRYVFENEAIVYMGGDDDFPQTLYYTNATPAALNGTYFANTLLVGQGDGGDINTIFALDNIVGVGTSKGSYQIDVTNQVSQKLDATNGMFSHRSVQNISGSVFYQSQRGIEALSPRTGLSSSSGVESKPKSGDLKPIMDLVVPKSRNYTCSLYVKALSQYYAQVDTDGDLVPDTTVVWNAMDKNPSWTKYELPSAYDFCIYEDSSGNEHYLLASAQTGQMYEFETGFTDNDVAIEYDLTTKSWDFDAPEMWKDYDTVDIFGYMSENAEITVVISVDDTIINSVTLDGTYANTSAASRTIGVYPIGLYPIGGGVEGVDLLQTYPYKIRVPVYAGGATVKIRMHSTASSIQWTYDKASIAYQAGGEMFTFANSA